MAKYLGACEYGSIVLENLTLDSSEKLSDRIAQDRHFTDLRVGIWSPRLSWLHWCRMAWIRAATKEATLEPSYGQIISRILNGTSLRCSVDLGVRPKWLK